MCLSIENQTHMTSTVSIFCVYVSEIACVCKIDYGFLDFKEELICIRLFWLLNSKSNLWFWWVVENAKRLRDG